MIDIIIPAFNAHKTIISTLSSLALQTRRDLLSIYIIDDASDKDYTYEITLFQKILNIVQITNETNLGPARSRQIGIESSKNDYLMFIDADDVLYDCFSISNMLKIIEKGVFDIISGVMIDESNNYNATNSHFGCLHGKVYRRDFLTINNICFSDFRLHEDNSFNQLLLMASPKIQYSSDYIYVYKHNPFSITKKDKNIELYSVNEYIENMIWAVEQAEKQGFNSIKIGWHIVNSLGYLYYVYCANINNSYLKNNKIKFKDIFYKYKEYSTKLTENKKNNIINFYLNKVETNISFYEFICMIEQEII